MELICPVCGKWTEVSDTTSYKGHRFRCEECWALLRIVSERPLRAERETVATATEAKAKVGRDVFLGGDDD